MKQIESYNYFRVLLEVQLRLIHSSIGEIKYDDLKNLDVTESDPRSDAHYLRSSENKAWKKIQALFSLLLVAIDK